MRIHTLHTERVKKVFAKLRLGHLNEEERTTIENVCGKYADIFCISTDFLKTIYTHSITLKPNMSSIFTKPYRVHKTQKLEVKTQITKILKEGIIEPSNSDRSVPVLLVPKKIDDNSEK